MLLLAVLVLAGCGREKKNESELIGIEEKDGYTLVTVRDPWKAGQTLLCACATRQAASRRASRCDGDKSAVALGGGLQ